MVDDPYLPPLTPLSPTEAPLRAPGPGTALDISLSGSALLALLTFIPVLVLFVLGQVVQLLNLPFGLIVTSLFIFGAAGLFFPATFNLRPAAFTGLTRKGSGFVPLAFLIGLANLPLANFLMGAMKELLPPDWSLGADATTELLLDASPAARIVLVIAAGIAAPIGEELFFRGWLQGILSQRMQSIVSIAIVAFVFSLVHGDSVGFVARVELGLVFGLSRLWSGSLWPAIAFHAAHNLVSTAALYLQSDPQADLNAPFEWGSAGAMAAGSLALTVILMWWFERISSNRHVVEPCDVPDEQRTPFAFTATRGARIFAPASALLLASAVVLVAVRDRLPGTDLTRETLKAFYQQLFPPPAPEPKPGRVDGP